MSTKIENSEISKFKKRRLPAAALSLLASAALIPATVVEASAKSTKYQKQTQESLRNKEQMELKEKYSKLFHLTNKLTARKRGGAKVQTTFYGPELLNQPQGSVEQVEAVKYFPSKKSNFILDIQMYKPSKKSNLNQLSYIDINVFTSKTSNQTQLQESASAPVFDFGFTLEGNSHNDWLFIDKTKNSSSELGQTAYSTFLPPSDPNSVTSNVRHINYLVNQAEETIRTFSK
ncbi:MAG TPA: hypothetical protein VLF63_00560 [Patescibacteria group bacterium]|nr:hypothetical protein [Patescibacteria group bacterium]